MDVPIVTHADIEASPVVCRRLPIVTHACGPTQASWVHSSVVMAAYPGTGAAVHGMSEEQQFEEALRLSAAPLNIFEQDYVP